VNGKTALTVLALVCMIALSAYVNVAQARTVPSKLSYKFTLMVDRKRVSSGAQIGVYARVDNKGTMIFKVHFETSEGDTIGSLDIAPGGWFAYNFRYFIESSTTFSVTATIYNDLMSSTSTKSVTIRVVP
jgi:hypothetical protein